MADSTAAKEESPAQRSARLRREKRNARIVSEGSDRLAKITQLSGRPAPAPEDAPLTKPNQQTSSSSSAPDPDEIDISDHHYTPRLTPRPSNPGTPSSQLQHSPFGPSPFGPMPPGFNTSDSSASQQDPMMALMQQMLSGSGGGGFPGMGSDPSNPNAPPPDLPPFMKSLFEAQSQTSATASKPLSSSAYLWRIIHAVFAVALALYITLSADLPFTGSKLSRGESAALWTSNSMSSSPNPKLFYVFATVELLLQTSRYFVEKGRLGGTGWLATIANSGLVPEPWGGYVRVAGRYAVIWQTVVADAMVVVFVLGCMAWWKGVAVAA